MSNSPPGPSPGGTEAAPAASPSGRLFLIDTMSYIFRAYHALPRLTNRAGQATHAVYGFHNMLRKLMADYQPEYIVAAFDLEGPTFRHESFAAYKANREEMPDDLATQIPYIRRLLDAARVPVVAHPGYEADDVIGTLARQAASRGLEVFIISSDKDMLQLVGDRVALINPMKDNMVFDPARVEETFGVAPGQVPDLLALQGDAVDNIPGAPGIGEKGARELIQKYGSVEQSMEHAGEVTRKTYRESLQNHRDQILLSKQLATIDCAAPVELSIEGLQKREPDPEQLRAIYQELDFTSLLRDLPQAGTASQQDYRDFSGEEELREFLHGLALPGPGEGQAVALAVEAEEPGPILPALRAAAVSAGPGTARVVTDSLLPLLGPWILGPWIKDPQRPKSVHDAKSASLVLARAGMALGGVRHDTFLYSYLLDAHEGNHTLEAVASRCLSAQAASSVAEQADQVGQLAALLRPEIEAAGLERLYEEIELPLVPILAEMETHGVKLDAAQLRQLSARLEEDLGKLTQEIYRLAGMEFNINSPKQLGEVLFEKLMLPAPRKRGKTRALSTAVDVLEALADAHEAPRRVLEYRQLAKLKSTYVDALPRSIDPRTGRLHTSFNQAGAATGRLSSRDPNLQNIPIRTELGREIRAAFVAEDGFVLLAADYSQIELRLLAHLSEDPLLVEAFRRGDDIHERTAEAVFGVPPSQQTPDHRRRAKAVNYGIVYGLSPFGLAQQLGIAQEEAAAFIQQYFERYEGVRKFRDAVLEEVRRTSQVRTFYGRLRKIPEINSRNGNLRQFAERAAINTPLQGGAADLIKLAMIGVHRRLRETGSQARLLLQVHDELVLEVPHAEVASVTALVREGMEKAWPFLVPLVAEVAAGPNWRDLETVEG